MKYAFGSTLCALLASRAAAQDVVEDASVTSPAERPTFTPTNLKAPFLEQFTDDWETRWQPSHAKKEDSTSDEDWAYVGQWEVEEPTVLPGLKGDKGLVVKNPAAHHAISAKFPKTIDNKGQDLVVQYEVKLQKGLECGGAYMKLLQDNDKLASDEFSNASPYVIMFGPDKCGATNKVHFIFKHKNPKTGEYEEKHMQSPPSIKNDKLSHVYTLVVRKDNSFELSIDGKSQKTGSLLEDFTPSVNPAAEIDDVNDTKPEDWVDQAKVADPESVKPEDWDEDAAFEVVDTEAEKPADWLEDEPLTVPDPEAERPEDWDDEEDGDWVPPQVPNPKCEDASGCGPWTAPMKRNPEYKGKYTAPLIDNPLYKGVWKPRVIQNPDFYEDKTPANLEPMGAIGFEIWTMQSDITFDNIYIGHSESDAAALLTETYTAKHDIEEAEEVASKPKPTESPKSPSDLKFADDPVTYIREKLELFIALVQKDPIEAVRFMPETAAALGVSVAALIGALVLLIGGGAAAAPSQEQVKKTAKDLQAKASNAANDASAKASKTADDVKAKAADLKSQASKAANDAGAKATDLKNQAVDAASSGAQVAQDEVNKRSTRSTGRAE